MFKLGDRVISSDGGTGRVICVDCDDEASVVILTRLVGLPLGGEFVVRCRNDGKNFADRVWSVIVAESWLNFYKTHAEGPFRDFEHANSLNGESPLFQIQIVTTNRGVLFFEHKLVDGTDAHPIYKVTPITQDTPHGHPLVS